MCELLHGAGGGTGDSNCVCNLIHGGKRNGGTNSACDGVFVRACVCLMGMRECVCVRGVRACGCVGDFLFSYVFVVYAHTVIFQVLLE